MRPWSEALCYGLADVYALATLVLVTAVAAFITLRQPARRLFVARSAVVGLAMLVILGVLPGWPQVAWPTLSARRQPTTLPVTTAPAQNPRQANARHIPSMPESLDEMSATRKEPPGHGREATDRNTITTVQPAVRAQVHPTPHWPTIAGFVFLTGSSLMLLWLGIGLWQTIMFRHRSHQAPAWLQETLARVVGEGAMPPALLLSETLSQPVAVGLLRPTIILPDRFVGDEPEPRLRAALAHEWAHIRNRDLWWLALSLLLMPLFFAHPVYWWLRRRIRDDQEILADAAAAADGRVNYAEVLLSWATGTPERPRLAVAGSVALWERPSQLKQRIVVLLDRNFRVEPTCPKRWGLGVRGGMALGVLALSVLTFRPVSVGADLPMPSSEPRIESKANNTSASGTTIKVLDPEGKPFVGARVFRSDIVFRGYDHDPRSAVRFAETGIDGSFQLTPDDVKAAIDREAQFVVMAERYGPAFTDPSTEDGMKVIRLVQDDVPIRGRILDIQAQPVAGATVQLVGFHWYPSANLDKWLEAWKTDEYMKLRSWASDDLPPCSRRSRPIARDGSL